VHVLIFIEHPNLHTPKQMRHTKKHTPQQSNEREHTHVTCQKRKEKRGKGGKERTSQKTHLRKVREKKKRARKKKRKKKGEKMSGGGGWPKATTTSKPIAIGGEMADELSSASPAPRYVPRIMLFGGERSPPLRAAKPLDGSDQADMTDLEDPEALTTTTTTTTTTPGRSPKPPELSALWQLTKKYLPKSL
jgi:hypothetical protein